MSETATSWDTATTDMEKFGFDAAAIEEFIATSAFCFWARLRKDGHPVGVYCGCAVDNGDLYLISNVYRHAYAAIKRDPRITVVLAKHEIGEVTIIGRGEPVDDYELVRKFFLRLAPNAQWVREGKMTVDQFMKISCSTSRRLIRVVREKVLSLDMSKLPLSDEA